MEKQKTIIFILAILLAISIVIIIYLILINLPMIEDTGEEIERKWLIKEKDIPYDLKSAVKQEIEQTYLCFSPEIRVRKIDNGAKYILTIKSNMSVDGLVRDEKEYYITEEEYKNLLTKKEGFTIEKTRYQIYDFYNNILFYIQLFAYLISILNFSTHT